MSGGTLNASAKETVAITGSSITVNGGVLNLEDNKAPIGILSKDLNVTNGWLTAKDQTVSANNITVSGGVMEAGALNCSQLNVSGGWVEADTLKPRENEASSCTVNLSGGNVKLKSVPDSSFTVNFSERARLTITEPVSESDVSALVEAFKKSDLYTTAYLRYKPADDNAPLPDGADWDGSYVEYTATITGFGEDRVDFAVEPGYPSAAEPTVEVTLLAGYPKQDKLEQIIKHGVELGAAHIVPFFSRYCVAAPKKEEQKNERYNRIALEAAKQCGRGVLPDVALPLPNFGAVCRSFDQYDLVLFCYECGGAPLRQLLAEAKPADGQKLRLAIVTGAEGGFAAEEAEMAASAGAKTVGLGPRILRCETAPLAVLSAVMTLTGNLE